jgi:hypothetical protein
MIVRPAARRGREVTVTGSTPSRRLRHRPGRPRATSGWLHCGRLDRQRDAPASRCTCGWTPPPSPVDQQAHLKMLPSRLTSTDAQLRPWARPAGPPPARPAPGHLAAGVPVGVHRSPRRLRLAQRPVSDRSGLAGSCRSPRCPAPGRSNARRAVATRSTRRRAEPNHDAQDHQSPGLDFALIGWSAVPQHGWEATVGPQRPAGSGSGRSPGR